MRGFGKGVWLAACAAALGGCLTLSAERDPVSRRISSEVALSDRRTQESLTLSRLAALERSINDFIQAKDRIPAKLTELIPDYLAEIPETGLGLREHEDSKAVRYYPASVILEGQINAVMLEDTGGWGYAFNEKQVIVFVDCIHKRSDGSPWYQARGVF